MAFRRFNSLTLKISLEIEELSLHPSLKIRSKIGFSTLPRYLEICTLTKALSNHKKSRFPGG
jgi:hypothetical protein